MQSETANGSDFESAAAKYIRKKKWLIIVLFSGLFLVPKSHMENALLHEYCSSYGVNGSNEVWQLQSM